MLIQIEQNRPSEYLIGLMFLPSWDDGRQCEVRRTNLSKIGRRVQSRPGKRGFVLLAISPDDTANQRTFFARREPSLGGITAVKRWWNDPYPFPFTWFFNPSAYIIDRKGVLRQYWEGAKSDEELRRTIAKYF